MMSSKVPIDFEQNLGRDTKLYLRKAIGNKSKQINVANLDDLLENDFENLPQNEVWV